MTEFDYKEYAKQMRENAVKDHYGDDSGVSISEAAYITGTKSVRSGVYIRLS